MQNYTLTLILRYTNGRISGLPIHCGPGHQVVSDGLLKVELESAERAGALEYSMSLSALEEIELRELDILVHSGVLQADADAYNPGFTTNCAACANKYSAMHEIGRASCRERV